MEIQVWGQFYAVLGKTSYKTYKSIQNTVDDEVISLYVMFQKHMQLLGEHRDSLADDRPGRARIFRNV